MIRSDDEDGNKRNRSRSRSRSREKNLQKKKLIVQKQFKEMKKEKNKMEQQDIDMFDDDDDDLQKFKEKNDGELITDDSGYFNVVVDKVIGQKYKIIEKLGKGVFGVVVKAQNSQSKEVFAIKILRKNSITEKSGERQFKILSELKNSKHIMEMSDYFIESGHLCLVCELLSFDLRDYAHKRSLTLEDIRIFAISMFIIMHELQKNKVIHADIKPDNFLFKIPPTPQMQEKQKIDNIKLCDFGTSYTTQEHNQKVQYIVARYYRAPEIILGTHVKKIDYFALDVWSVGCSLFELYTDQFLFNGNDNNEMLKLMMETKGKFSMKMINKSEFKEKHFDGDYNFLFRYNDKYTNEARIKKIQPVITPQRQLFNMLKKYKKEEDNMKNLQKFKDFLEKCLALNPKDRLKPQEALQHPFIQYQTKLN